MYKQVWISLSEHTPPYQSMEKQKEPEATLKNKSQEQIDKVCHPKKNVEWRLFMSDTHKESDHEGDEADPTDKAEGDCDKDATSH